MARFKVLLLVVLLLAVGLPSSARSEPLPSLDQIMTAKERGLFADRIRGQLGSTGNDQKAFLTFVDGILAQDPEPTEFRGYMQMLRAVALSNQNRGNEAMTAIDEAIRLLPRYSQPLLVGVDIYAFADRSAKAADLLLRVAEIDPVTARSINDYDLSNLLHRLRATHEVTRLGAVADRMLSIGWTGDRLDGRSDLAFETIKRKAAAGDIEGARAWVPELVKPEQSYALLADNKYQKLWPDVERWSGAKLRRQWGVYLTEAKARFDASRATDNVLTYVRALNSAGMDDHLIFEILPLLSENIDPKRDEEMVYIVPNLAGALARAGRWSDVNSLFARAESMWPLGSSALALNVSANDAEYLLRQGRTKDALKQIDVVIEDAKTRGGEVNQDALAAMHAVRACALHRLGRDADAGPSLAATFAASIRRRVELSLCLGDLGQARRMVVEGFRDEGTRDEVLDVLQPPDHAPCKSDYCATIARDFEAIGRDPAVLAELKKYGRTLPFRMNEAAAFASPAKSKEERTVI